MDKKTLKIIIFLAILGIFVSAYLLKLYYSDGSPICDIGDTFSCTDVKNSDYSEAFGIPMAGYGLMVYFLIGLMAVCRYKKEQLLKNVWLQKAFTQQNLFYVSFTALIFSLYLTYIEFFIIKALCLFCLISLGIIMVITFYTYKNLKIKENKFEFGLNK